jgi:diguanylate cyclase (GGDEF)-like protein/PAS domain S-box-containing protein
VESDLRLKDDFRGLLESVPDAMVIVDAFGEIVIVNTQTEKLFGYQRDELLGQRVEVLVSERFRDGHLDHRSGYAIDPHPRLMGESRELYGRRKDGTEFPAEISVAAVQTESGTLVSNAIRDITERTRSAQDAALFRAVIESSHDAIVSEDLDGVILSWNSGAETLYGYRATEAVSKSMSMLVPPGRDDEYPDVLRRVRFGEQIDDYETIRERKDGTQVDVSLTVSPIRDRDGTIIGSSTIARDVGVKLRYQEQLRRLAEHDPLTGLRNRRRFERDVTEQVGRARRFGEQATLLIIDINGFKRINDTFGHRAGDRVLKAISTAMTTRLRDTDVVARIGGDEFAVLLPYANAEQGAIIAADLRDAIDTCAVEIDGRMEVRVTACVGLVEIDKNSKSEEDVIVEADRLMYLEKRGDQRRADDGLGDTPLAR